MPFFDQSQLAWTGMVASCTLAAVADAGIMVLAHMAGSWLAGRRWHGNPSLGAIGADLATGLAATVAAERWALRSFWRWSYDAAMPVVPMLGVGPASLAMWLVVPLAALGMVRGARI